MKKIYILFFVFTCLAGFMLLYTSLLSSASEEIPAGKDINEPDLRGKAVDIQPKAAVKPDLNFGKLPLYFIANKGQLNEKAKFYAKTSRYTLWLTKEGLVFDRFKRSTVKGERSKEDRGDLSQNSPHSSYTTERDVSRLLFVGANKKPGIVPVEEAKLKVNYFIGNDRSKWHCDVPTTQAVLYKNLYKNIVLKVYGIEKQIEYDWIIKPGGNPFDIRFEYKNVKGTHINKKGNLVICTEFGELIHKKPVSYQVEKVGGTEALRQEGNKAKKEMVEVTFKKLGKNTFGFVVGDYDKSRELIIDPVVLAYSTYLGGSKSEGGVGIAVDSSGYVYVTGDTESTDFPTLNPYQTYQGFRDIFVTKLNANGNGLIYSTYLGGGGNDYGADIAVDGSGYAYVTGRTCSKDFPTLNPYQTYRGSSDIFVTKLNANGDGLIYSTYLGGGDNDSGAGIAVDGSGYAYVTGRTYSKDFPTLNPYQTYRGGSDVFIIKLNAAGDGLIYSTYLGGKNGDWGVGIAVDGSGHAYVTGVTWSTDFPTMNPYQTHQGSGDIFVTKLNANGDDLIYSTYLGGGNSDGGYGIAVDGSGYAYVTGGTYSADFPTLNPYQTYQGGADVVVTRLNANGDGLIYSTYLGGGNLDWGTGITVDGSGYAYVTGETESTDFPTLNPYQGTFQGIWCDAFVTKIDTTQSGVAGLIYSTYLGGSDDDRGCGIAVDGSGYAYVTGGTYSADFPTQNPYQAYQGGWDVFVTRLNIQTPPTVTTAAVSNITATTAIGGGNVTNNGGAVVTYRGVCWSTSANPTTDDSYTRDGSGTGKFVSSITGLTPGTMYYVRAYATNSHGTGYGETLSFNTLNIILSLNATRETESAWIIRRQYGKINLVVTNPDHIPVAKYIIYRKESGGVYSHLTIIPASQTQDGQFAYYDKYLDNDKTYNYKFTAVDAAGVTIGISNEKTI